jgi:hypothetical protein
MIRISKQDSRWENKASTEKCPLGSDLKCFGLCIMPVCVCVCVCVGLQGVSEIRDTLLGEYSVHKNKGESLQKCRFLDASSLIYGLLYSGGSRINNKV